MPLDSNLNQSNAGILNANSVRAWMFTTPFSYPPSPTPMPLPEAEVPAASAHFVVYELFPNNNQGGVSLGRGSVDTDGQAVLAAYKASSTEELLLAAFPPPGSTV